MLKQNQKIISALNMMSDGLIVFISYYISLYIRFVHLDGVVTVMLWEYPYNLIMGIYSVAIVLIYIIAGMYNSRKFSVSKEHLKIFVLNGIGVVGLTAAMYMWKLQDFSRGVILLLWIISSVFFVIKRLVTGQILQKNDIAGFGKRTVLIIGNGNHAVKYIKNIRENSHLGIDVAGYIGVKKDIFPVANLGRYEDLEKILADRNIDELIVALEAHEIGYMKSIISCAEKEGVRLSLIPFYEDYFPARTTVENIGSSKLIDMRSTPLDNLFNALIKRFIDVFGSIVLIILTSPLMLITIIGVRMSGPGKVLFKQRRVGKNKKQFDMLKFRSMHENPAEETGWSTNGDRRKTKFGSIIRKFSIDELPQLFNVLKGDMSLVGPRPEVPFYVRQFKEDVPLYLVRQQVRPGMTGWAQVHGLRGDTSIEDRVKYDIWYIQNWSLWLDIKILLKTAMGGFINNEEILK